VSAFIDFAVKYMTNELKPGPSNQLSRGKNSAGTN
jgi:hypothetical protein